MNVLILGDGPEERAWAAALADRPDHPLAAAFPGLPGFEHVPRPRDLDDALVVPGVDAVVVGGDPAFRAEALRRAAAEGQAVIVLHPPGVDSEAYYQVALSRAETGAVVVPDLPLRHHPGVAALRQAYDAGSLGTFRSLRYEATVGPDSGDLARYHLPRVLDLIRSLIGEIEAVSATGDPPGERPDEQLVVQLRGPWSRRAEVRLTVGRPESEPARLVLTGTEGALTLEFPPDAPARLTRAGSAVPEDFPDWDPWTVTLDLLSDAVAKRAVHPDLLDGTRAVEVAEGAVRSLRRGRTVELHYEEISEVGTFKSVMTSLGCVVLLSILVVVPVALVGPAIGLPWTIHLAYVIPPALLLFLGLQALRFAAKGGEKPGGEVEGTYRGDRGEKAEGDSVNG